MPALLPTEFTGEITWLGFVPDRAASLKSDRVSEAQAGFAGIIGEAHGGVTRPSCARVTAQYPHGTDIRNVRQLTIVSEEELAAMAREIGVDAVDPAWIGASMVIRGLPDFTHVPPSSRLQTQAGTTLTIDMANRPCNLPAKVIEAEVAGAGKAFKRAADQRRGVTAWVEREGPLRFGDSLVLHVPDQRVWQHMKDVLTGK